MFERPGWRRRVAALAALLAVLPIARGVEAKVLLSRDRALKLAFGDAAELKRDAVFLTQQQLERARELAGEGVEVRSALVTRYVARLHGKILGTAYFDTHRVRTLQETLMVVVLPDLTVGRLEILSFDEPQEYLPRAGWLEQFNGRPLDRGMALKRQIHGITGATLSAKAITRATRRILAVHRVLAEGDEGSIGQAAGSAGGGTR